MFKAPVASSVVEGLDKKPYAIPNRRLDYVKVPHLVTIAFRCSVGYSMNDYFYESFLDDIAEAGDPFALRMALLKDSPRQRTLLQAVADLAGGWRREPFEVADGSQIFYEVGVRRTRGPSSSTTAGRSAPTTGTPRCCSSWATASASSRMTA